MRNDATKAAGAVLAVLIVAALLSSYRTPIDLSSQAELKKFSSLEELNAFLASAQQVYGASSLRAMTAEASSQDSSKANGANNDYSSTNVQVANVDEADFVKNDGKYIYTITDGNVTIIDAYPAESARIISSINTGGTPLSLYVNGDRLVVISSVYDYAARDATSEKESLIYRPYASKTQVAVYDITDRTIPTMERNVTVDGSYMDSRMTGGYVYAIINEPAGSALPVFSPNQRSFPDIYYFDVPSSYYTYNNIISLNVNDAGEGVKSKVFLIGGYSTIYVSQGNIYTTYQKSMGWGDVQEALVDGILPALPQNLADKVREIRASDITDKQQAIARSFDEWLRGKEPEEAARLYKDIEQKSQEKMSEIQKELQKTIIHKVSISNGDIEYKTHGEVPGTPLNQFSMDEYNGYFRIATTTDASSWGVPVALDLREGSIGIAVDSSVFTDFAVPDKQGIEQQEEGTAEKDTIPPEQLPPVSEIPAPGLPPGTPSQSNNNVYVLDENMNVVGSLENLAPGERIYSVRFMGERAYLVTFVRIDPLFVIDLSNPAAPKVLGELKIPGVSDYLHPYDETHIIGIGRGADDAEGRVTFKGVKVSLFDVSDVTNPKETATYELGDRGTDSEALHDHKAFLFSREKGIIVLPVSVADEPYKYAWQGSLVLNVDGNSISERGRITHSEAGNETGMYYYPQYPARRALYIGDTLYSVATDKIIAADLTTLQEVDRIVLSVESWDGIVYNPLAESRPSLAKTDEIMTDI